MLPFRCSKCQELSHHQVPLKCPKCGHNELTPQAVIHYVLACDASEKPNYFRKNLKILCKPSVRPASFTSDKKVVTCFRCLRELNKDTNK